MDLKVSPRQKRQRDLETMSVTRLNNLVFELKTAVTEKESINKKYA